jgi:hypothetical protein
MPVKLLRRMLSVFVVTAYVGATTLQFTPAMAAHANMSHAAMSGMTHEQDHPGDKMPCKGMLPGCITDLGCIFLISLLAPELRLVTLTAWSSVFYNSASEGLQGRTIKPALGPPISLA